MSNDTPISDIIKKNLGIQELWKALPVDRSINATPFLNCFPATPLKTHQSRTCGASFINAEPAADRYAAFFTP